MKHNMIKLRYPAVAILALVLTGVYYKWRPVHSDSPAQHVKFTPSISLENPFETPEERQQRIARLGFQVEDDAGNIYLRILRKDGEAVTKGLPPREFIMESTMQPHVTRSGNTWEVVFENVVPTPEPLQ